MMKKVWILLMIAVFAIGMVGCSDQKSDNKDETTGEAATQLHTVPPADTTSEPEWAPVDCNITLQSDTQLYADSADFMTFALVGSTDEDCELRFAFDETAAAKLAQAGIGADCYITVDSRQLNGSLTFNSDYTEASLKGGYTYAEMCELASAIRGV